MHQEWCEIQAEGENVSIVASMNSADRNQQTIPGCEMQLSVVPVIKHATLVCEVRCQFEAKIPVEFLDHNAGAGAGGF